jgi:ribosome biogenesis GTPase
MGSDDKQRQRARYLHGAAREAEHRTNQRLRKQRRGRDDEDFDGGLRSRRRAEDWLEDGGGEHETFEKIGRTRPGGPPVESGSGPAASGGPRATGPSFAGTVIARHRDASEVALDRRAEAGDSRSVRVPVRPDSAALVVGDVVELAVDEADGSFRLASVAPRRTLLERPDPADPRARLTVAANVDIVVAVLSADRLRPGLVDRLALAAARGGASVLVCVNKIDLATAEHAAALDLLRAVARELDLPYLEVSAQTGAGLGALRARLAGSTCVFVGPSGAGKSSLCNALDPSLELRIGDVRDRDRRGRHTTTSSSLHRLAGDIALIDTPGVRAFGLGEVSADELAAAFPELARAARGCRFRDCVHDTEPDCAVREEVDSGRIPASRLAAWRRLRAADG